MANLGATFDASQVDPSQPQENLPPGDYRVQIINSEMRVTKAGTGQYLWLEMDVLDGPFAGRKVYDRLNLINPNSQAVEISQRTLSAICHALGRMQVKDSEELHFQPLLVKVTVGKSGYNEVKGYRPGNGAASPTTPPATPPNQGYQPQPQAVPSNQAYQPPPQASPSNQGYQPPPQPTATTQPGNAPPVQQLQSQPPVAPPPTSGGNGPWRRMG